MSAGWLWALEPRGRHDRDTLKEGFSSGIAKQSRGMYLWASFWSKTRPCPPAVEKLSVLR